ncbi:MAG: hypothetical protein ORN50_06130, partial [Crocinitomicaceae bacterium]|nr:hypothetical protein [Crocinitomicaceae bacterium]
MTTQFKSQMKKSLKRTATAINEEYKRKRFNYGSHNKVRLNKALASLGKYELQDTTLLSPSVHDVHSKKLADRFLKRVVHYKNLGYKNTSAIEKFRFLTLLHSVEIMDVQRTIQTIKKFQSQLQNTIESSKGIWCLGAVEVEVINIEMMRMIHEDQTESEARKLSVIESMIKRLRKNDQQLESFFLVHFHGIVTASSQYRFNDFFDVLKKNKDWKREPRQIQLKTISKQFKSKLKTLDKNLVDIARYITKGGNDWSGGKSYLRYKLAFENEYLFNEDAWVNKNHTRNETLKKEKKEDGIEDALSMNVSEIVSLATVIDAMMAFNRTRTGYLVSAKSK